MLSITYNDDPSPILEVHGERSGGVVLSQLDWVTYSLSRLNNFEALQRDLPSKVRTWLLWHHVPFGEQPCNDSAWLQDLRIGGPVPVIALHSVRALHGPT